MASTVAVTGCTGYIGSQIVHRLISTGYVVRCVVRAGHWSKSLPHPGEGCSKHNASLESVPELTSAFKGADCVVHAAGMISTTGRRTDKLHTVNVLGTENVILASQAAAIRRLLYVSSIETFPLGERRFPIRGNEPIDPEQTILPYGASKALAALKVASASSESLETIACAPTAVIGPPDRGPSRMGQVILEMATGRLPVTVPGSFDFVDVRDVANGIVLALERGSPGATYVLGGHHTTIESLVSLVCVHSGATPPRVRVPVSLIRLISPAAQAIATLRGKEARFSKESVALLQLGVTVSLNRSRTELGYRPRPIEITIRDLIDWYRSEGMLG